MQRTGLTPIDVEPIWNKDQILLFDMYDGDNWVGSHRTLKQCEVSLLIEEEVKASKERTYPRLVSIILIQEILPRVKKHKLNLSDFPPAFCSILTALEFTGSIDRKSLRSFLDDHCNWVKAGRPRDEEEDQKLIEEIKEKISAGL